MAGKKGEKPERGKNRAASLSTESDDRHDYGTAHEITMTTYFELTNKRIDELQSNLITRQEQRLAELKSEHASEISALRTELAELKESLEFSQAELAALKSSMQERSLADSSVAATKVNQIESTLSSLARQVDYIDNQGRRNNIRVDGIQEEPGESWDCTESKCLEFFMKDLNLTTIQVERAHRIGPAQQGKTRTIVVKLLSYKDREAILKKAKEIRPKGIFVNQDFSVRVSKVRKELRSHIHNLKQQGHEVYLSFDRIRYRSRPPGSEGIPPGSISGSGSASTSGRGNGRGGGRGNARGNGRGKNRGRGGVSTAPWAGKTQIQHQQQPHHTAANSTVQPDQHDISTHCNAIDEDITSLKMVVSASKSPSRPPALQDLCCSLLCSTFFYQPPPPSQLPSFSLSGSP